jgi:hypothetical protein
MARDEGQMLDRWVRHYSAQLGAEHLIVLDDNSTDGSTDDLPCTVHRLPQLPGTHEFERTRMKLVSGLAKGLLAVYDYVAFVDADEFLLADPAKYADLTDFLKARPSTDVIAGMCLNVVHYAAVEPDLEPTLPTLGQRRYAKFVPSMCKPALKRIPAPWGAASHGIGAPFTVDPELFMIHLKFHDREQLRARAEQRKSLVDADGRGISSTWRMGGSELTSELDGFVRGVDPEKVLEFDPQQVDLDSIVHQYQVGLYRTTRDVGQVKTMRTEPLVRIPERLLGKL